MMSPLDSRIMDINSEYLGVKTDILMENAGEQLANVISDLYSGKRILFICGTGNNGGDGFVAARLLSADVAVINPPKSELAKEMFAKISASKYSEDIIGNYDVIVDCLLGTGIKGTVREEYAKCIKAINNSGKTVISCDIPSGFGTECSVKPEVTVTFHDLKEGMNENTCGKIVIADIGIPEDAYTYVGLGDMLRYPVPEKESHKGQNGRLLIIGGGPYIGAPAMSGMAAFRIGADLVRIATPDSSFSEISSFCPMFIMHRIPGNHLTEDSVDMLLQIAENTDAVLIGPGLGTDPETMNAVRSFTAKCSKPMVIDADGITAISEKPIGRDAPTVYTPHHAEFRRLTGDMDQSEFSAKYNATIVLKGAEDVITDGVRTRRNRTGTPAMTSGGTGDVLAGTIAGLLSKGMNPFDAGCLGAYICGKAGEYAFNVHSYGLMATDIIDNISRVLRDGLK